MKHFYREVPHHEWMNFEGVYRQAVERGRDGDVFVELGSWLGASAAFMAVEIVNSGTKIAFHCVDNWAGGVDVPEIAAFHAKNDSFAMFKETMQKGGVWDRIRAHKMDSALAARLFQDKSVAFCFLDADHSYDATMRNIAAWLLKMAPGGIIAGHDHDESFLGVVHAVLDSFDGDIQVIGNCWLHQC